MKIILCGAGFWGKKILRNLEKFDNLEIICVEPNQECWKHLSKYRVYADIGDALRFDDRIKAVFICTPISTHFELIKICLENNINVFVEKPMCTTTVEAAALLKLRKSCEKILFVGHTFIFSSPVKKLLSLVNDTLGNLQFFHADWSNLGVFQREADVLLDLAPHPFSILKVIKPVKPSFVSAVGTSHSKTNYINSVNVSVGYYDNFQAYIHLNWICPKKARQITIAGDKKMVVYDDTSNDEKLRIYDCGFDEDEESRFSYRKGDILTPKIDESEAIYNEIEYFFQCINLQTENHLSDSQFGFEVVELIEAAQKSVSKNGTPVYL